MKKHQIFFLSENFHFLVVKFSVYLNKHVFVMGINKIKLVRVVYNTNIIHGNPMLRHGQKIFIEL